MTVSGAGPAAGVTAREARGGRFTFATEIVVTLAPVSVLEAVNDTGYDLPPSAKLGVQVSVPEALPGPTLNTASPGGRAERSAVSRSIGCRSGSTAVTFIVIREPSAP